ncbi:flagellar basal body-associated FliL family protein [Desulfoferrobacter suflitae]|uniref:flagellar basal body-associated FliL family protein n=1 Tax=Desulfoferrobacter suflitae TaxID=2865782 RepID=UPI00216446DD|nr:flagellar basal body-associated FliL family protein [Desulfoferrobacter suflitae]MCK8602432.1 flagellar basal body-associated FliL family protein [Desulfoferrobacter suflitae]
MVDKRRLEESETTPLQKNSKWKWIVLVLLLAMAGSGAYLGWSYFFQESGAVAEVRPEAKVEQEMDTFLVNLADPGGKRYLKISMKLVLNNAQAAAQFNARSAELRDSVLLLLSSKKYDDIATFAGKMALKQEAIAQLNQKLGQGQVEDIYFTELLVQ